MRGLPAVLAAGLLAAACAAPDAAQVAESPSLREYPTGSNLPRKASQRDQAMEGVRVYGPQALEGIQNSGSPGKTAEPR